MTRYEAIENAFRLILTYPKVSEHIGTLLYDDAVMALALPEDNEPSNFTWLIERGSPAQYIKRFDSCDDIIVWTEDPTNARQFYSRSAAAEFATRASHTAVNFDLTEIRICDHIGLGQNEHNFQPVAWLHNVVQNDGDGEQDDLVLSFSPDNFPLEGDEPYLWRSLKHRPLYLLPKDSKLANAELYGLAMELADMIVHHDLPLLTDEGGDLSPYSSHAVKKFFTQMTRYLELRKASGEPMPYKVVRDGDKVRFL